MIDVKKYLKVLKKTKLTQRQYFLLYCLYFRYYAEIKEYHQLFPLEEHGNPLMDSREIKDLIDKGYLIKLKENPTTAADYKISTKFAELFVDSYIAIDEVFELYPDFLLREKVNYPLKAADREQLGVIYFTSIAGLIEEHTLVIDDIQYMVDNNLTYCNLDKFVRSKGWLVIRKLRTNPSSQTAPIQLIK